MVELAHNMEMKVVAEGVESQEMMRALRGWGCDIAQGFFISQPIPSQDVIPWLQQRLSQAGSA
jgi:EAL domain-containing protein (putative c-di-GMP-specific phosphodiesterase class I)